MNQQDLILYQKLHLNLKKSKRICNALKSEYQIFVVCKYYSTI